MNKGIYHLVGIKGTGMAPLALVLSDMGFHVQGSDVTKRFFTQANLEERGITILPFDKNNIKLNQTVIQGNAFPDTHEEIIAAKELGVPVIRYHHFLGELSKKFTSIAVTGVHGKTSTTGLLAYVLEGVSKTSCLIGDGTGRGVMDSKYFVFESCEYRRHFLSYYPSYAIITNIDFDHPDYFPSVDDVQLAFQQMSNQVSKGIIAYGDDNYVRQIKADVPIIYYGFGEMNDFQAQNVVKTTEGTSFDVFVRDEFFASFMIPRYGNHHVMNALAIISFCHHEQMDVAVIKERLQTFEGVKRRFNEKQVGSQVVIDDYAHHPTEINVTIESVRQKYPNRKVVAIFQPHTYSRTKMFLTEFAESLSKADEVYLCNIFGSAREEDGDLSIKDLQNRIPNAHFLEEKSVNELTVYDTGVLVFMGAGDIQKFQEAYEKTI